MSPAEIRKSLQGLTNEIVGEVQVRKALKKTAASPPNYSGSGKSGRPAGNLSLTDDERGFIKNLRAAGLSEKDVKESLREYRRDMGR